MNINKQDIEKAQQAASARWGKWVSVLIGVIIGALAAAGYITVTDCGHPDYAALDDPTHPRHMEANRKYNHLVGLS